MSDTASVSALRANFEPSSNRSNPSTTSRVAALRQRFEPGTQATTSKTSRVVTPSKFANVPFNGSTGSLPSRRQTFAATRSTTLSARSLATEPKDPMEPQRADSAEKPPPSSRARSFTVPLLDPKKVPHTISGGHPHGCGKPSSGTRSPRAARLTQKLGQTAKSFGGTIRRGSFSRGSSGPSFLSTGKGRKNKMRQNGETHKIRGTHLLMNICYGSMRSIIKQLKMLEILKSVSRYKKAVSYQLLVWTTQLRRDLDKLVTTEDQHVSTTTTPPSSIATLINIFEPSSPPSPSSPTSSSVSSVPSTTVDKKLNKTFAHCKTSIKSIKTLLASLRNLTGEDEETVDLFQKIRKGLTRANENLKNQRFLPPRSISKARSSTSDELVSEQAKVLEELTGTILTFLSTMDLLFGTLQEPEVEIFRANAKEPNEEAGLREERHQLATALLGFFSNEADAIKTLNSHATKLSIFVHSKEDLFLTTCKSIERFLGSLNTLSETYIKVFGTSWLKMRRNDKPFKVEFFANHRVSVDPGNGMQTQMRDASYLLSQLANECRNYPDLLDRLCEVARKIVTLRKSKGQPLDLERRNFEAFDGMRDMAQGVQTHLQTIAPKQSWNDKKTSVT